MKATAVYIMGRDDWTDTWELHVSNTAKIMRNHITKFSKETCGVEEKDVSDTLGMVHPVNSTGNCFAYCFLNEENLGAGIVAHECGHVAFAHERFVLRFGMNYGNDCNENEERVLHFMTDCIKGVYNVLYAHKHIKG
jgi:hypothetical protein